MISAGSRSAHRGTIGTWYPPVATTTASAVSGPAEVVSAYPPPRRAVSWVTLTPSWTGGSKLLTKPSR